MQAAIVTAALWALGCSGSERGAPSPAVTAHDPTAADLALSPDPSDSAPDSPAADTTAAPVSLAAADSTAPAPPAAGGHDFIAQASALYTVVACGGDAPPGFHVATVRRHCRRLRRRIERYRTRWASRASAFIADLRPPGLPATAVYPFGGGDLVSALVAFPDADEITTLSLEAAGDPRRIDALAGPRARHALDAELALQTDKLDRLFRSAHSTTKSLQQAARGAVPGTLFFALAALAVHGHEPVSLRYFDVEDDGSLRYLDLDELERRVADTRARRRAVRQNERRKRFRSRQVWRAQDAAFANMELVYRPIAANPADAADAVPRLRVYRHIVANLDDPHQGDDPRVLRHLEGKGDVVVITKAASYLLWLDEFSHIRDYLLAHAVWMISDSSGIPPKLAAAAGFEHIPYGVFTGPYFRRDPNRVYRQLVDLWARSPRRPLPFRFGYPDADNNHHMMIMRRKPR